MGGGDRLDALGSSAASDASAPSAAAPAAAETTPQQQQPAPVDDVKRMEGDYVWIEKEDAKASGTSSSSSADRVSDDKQPGSSDTKASASSSSSSSSTIGGQCETDCCAWLSCSRWSEWCSRSSGMCGGGGCGTLWKVLALALFVKILMCCKLLLFIIGALAVGCWYSCCRQSCGTGASKCPFSGLSSNLPGLGASCPMSGSSSTSSSQASSGDSKKDR